MGTQGRPDSTLISTATRSLKLLVLNWQDRQNPQSGGAEVHLHEIFGRLAGWGHEVTLLVSRWKGAAQRSEVDGMQVHRVGGRHSYPLYVPGYYRRYLAAQRFDLVIEDLNKVPLWTPLWAGRPVVLLVHHLFGATAFSTASFPVAAATWLSERPLPLVYRRLPVQVVSESTAEDLVRRGFLADRIQVVHNGVDLEFFSRDPNVERTNWPSLVYVGRLQRYKRVDILIRAMPSLLQARPDARLVIAGRGGSEGELRRLAEQLGVEGNVDFLGFVDEERKRDLLRRAWVHVLTSPKEGWGLTVMEAAACGTPTVASDSPGLRDSVVDGVTGLLVPHGDYRRLADEVARLIGDRDLLERMGQAAADRAVGFSWERSARETEQFLQRVATERD